MVAPPLFCMYALLVSVASWSHFSILSYGRLVVGHTTTISHHTFTF
jgi:hypothetical protein